MVRRMLPFALAAVVAVGVVGPLAACNALTGAGDLEARDCPECTGASPDADVPEGGSRADAFVEGGGPKLDSGPDGLGPPQPGGFLDTTFGSAGVATSALLSAATSVAVRADGKIYIGGVFSNALSVIRLNANGAVDTTFGAGGRVSAPTLTGSLAQSIAIDAQGRVVAAGYATEFDPVNATTMTYAYVVRMNDAGLDPSFATAGRRIFANDGETASAVLMEGATGNIVVGGRAPNVNGPVTGALWELSTAGALLGARVDVAYAAGEPASITAMVLGAADVTVVGLTTSPTTSNDYGVARISALGFDTTFSGGGRTRVVMGTSSDLATGVARLSDGSVVVAGTTTVPFTLTNRRSQQCALARLLANGTPAPAFGAAGKAIIDFGQAGVIYENAGDHVGGVVADVRDNVVVVGFADEKVKPQPSTRRVVMMRVRPDGQLDPLFATMGKLTFSFDTGTDSRATAIAKQPDGKLVVVGDAAGGIGFARVTP